MWLLRAVIIFQKAAKSNLVVAVVVRNRERHSLEETKSTNSGSQVKHRSACKGGQL